MIWDPPGLVAQVAPVPDISTMAFEGATIETMVSAKAVTNTPVTLLVPIIAAGIAVYCWLIGFCSHLASPALAR